MFSIHVISSKSKCRGWDNAEILKHLALNSCFKRAKYSNNTRKVRKFLAFAEKEFSWFIFLSYSDKHKTKNFNIQRRQKWHIVFLSYLKFLDIKWTLTNPSDKINWSNSVSRSCVYDAILRYSTLNSPWVLIKNEC